MDEAIFEIQEDHLQEMIGSKQNFEEAVQNNKGGLKALGEDELAKIIYDASYKSHYKEDILKAIEKE